MNSPKITDELKPDAKLSFLKISDYLYRRWRPGATRVTLVAMKHRSCVKTPLKRESHNCTCSQLNKLNDMIYIRTSL